MERYGIDDLRLMLLVIPLIWRLMRWMVGWGFVRVQNTLQSFAVSVIHSGNQPKVNNINFKQVKTDPEP